MMLMVVNEMKYKFRVCLEESLWSELNLLKICYVNEKFLYISLFLQTMEHLNMSNYSPPPTHTHTQLPKFSWTLLPWILEYVFFSFEGSFLSNNPLKQLVYSFVFWSIVQFDGQFILWHQVAFPAQEKRLDALILCTNEIFLYLEENLKLTPENMSDKAVALDELKEMHQQVSIWLSKS